MCHEIGRSHLELENFEEARNFGKKSLASGEECKDLVWQLNASVLVGQSEMMMHEIEFAYESFTHALKIAIQLEDGGAQASISKALAELKELSRRLSRPQVAEHRKDGVEADENNEGENIENNGEIIENSGDDNEEPENNE